MSHFTSIKTQMVEQEYLTEALTDLGYVYETGNVQIRGFAGIRKNAQIKIPTQNPSYDIGFQKVDNSYQIVADWWGIRGIKQQEFQDQLTQRYAYHATKAKLYGQGFSLVSEDVEQGQRLHLVLRRVA